FGALIDAWDWPAAFLMSGLLTMLLGVLWWIFAAERPEPPAAAETATGIRPGEPPLLIGRREDRDNWFDLFRNRNVMLLTISYGTMSYLEYLFFFWMNHYFLDLLQIGKQRARIYTAILFLSMAVGMVAGGWLADRLRKSFGPWIGPSLVPMAGMTLGALFLGLGVIEDREAWIVLWLSIALGSVGAAEGPSWTAAVELGGKQGGTAAAIVNTGGNLGGFIAPFLTPIVSHAVRDSFGLSDQAGWPWGIALARLLCLSGGRR